MRRHSSCNCSLLWHLNFSLPDCNVPAHILRTLVQSVLSYPVSGPASSFSFPPPPPPWAAEKLSLMRTQWGGERCSGPMGSCCSSTERLPFKHTHTHTHTHLLTNTNNGLHGCRFSELGTLTRLPSLSPLVAIKGPLFRNTATQLTGPTEAGRPRMSSIHYCLVMEG